MNTDKLVELVLGALNDLKGRDIQVLDVRGKTSITDVMVIASGTSNRHVRSLADAVIDKAKQAGHAPLGIEGESVGEWVLVDLLDVVVHVMQPQTRAFYSLEKLWSVDDGLSLQAES
ncbi:MAG: ribosome silencing factor [Gammaproteobacteria bacterium]|nr:MAG: ribosome silencing factor [Gammaproteobacteria bacterium]